MAETTAWTTSEWNKVFEFIFFTSLVSSLMGWIIPVSLLAHIAEATIVFSFTAFRKLFLSNSPVFKHSANVTRKSLSLIHSAEARTASCSILEVTKLELDSIPLLNNDLMLQLSASVPPLVNIISFGATSKIDEIISLDSSNIFFAFLDKLCPPEEFANPSCSASIKALIAISRIGVVAAWSR